jgi:hypothetical protein
MAAGDIACDPNDSNYNGGAGTTNPITPSNSACQQLATSQLVTGAVAGTVDAVLPLGDTQYADAITTTIPDPNTYLQAYDQVYNPTWGRAKGISHPVVGNHEYDDQSGADAYYNYFGSAASPDAPGCISSSSSTANCKGYYSYNLGNWHIIALNSECGPGMLPGGCGAGSPQEVWLKKDLAANPNMCTLAYWHEPLFTSGWSVGLNTTNLTPLWIDLYNAHADLVLNAHDHDYERFAPQDPNGTAASNGITEIVVGTGGASHFDFSTAPPGGEPNSVVGDYTTFGVLKLTLHPKSFDWQFIPDKQSGNGTFTDAGTRSCHL